MVEPIPILERFLGDYALTATQVIYFLVSFLIIYFLGKLIVLKIIRRILDKHDMDEHARKPLMKISKFLVLFVGITIAFGVAGFGNFLTALATIGAAATLAIGFAMKNVVENFVSGVFIYTEKPFEIGDWIIWDGNEGVVEDIQMRVTKLKTFDNELLTVPNAQLTNNVLKNPVAEEKLRLKFTFGISYEDDIEKASDIIIRKAEENDEILDEPEPSVRVTELADSYVGIQSRIWIGEPSRADFIKTKSDYVRDVKEKFDEEDIEIPFPQVDLSGSIETG